MMGGKALKKIKTRRINKDEFLEISQDVQNKLFHLLKTDVFVVPSYFNKNDYGDIDLLIKNRNFSIEIVQILKENFEPTEIVHNGNVYSFDYLNVQIDLIFIDERFFEIAKVYFSYNDLGNLMGKIYNQFGLKYGFKGLFYLYRGKDIRFSVDIEISKDPIKIFGFLGLDYYEFDKGFNELEDIFEFVIKSKYFNKDIFRIENLNAEQKKRNRKRKGYLAFIEYLNKKNISSKYEFLNDKEYYLKMIDEYFSEAKIFDKINEIKLKELKMKELYSKFNGNLLKEKFGLYGKELGYAMSCFKDWVKKDLNMEFEAFLDVFTKEEIMNLFEYKLKKCVNTKKIIKMAYTFENSLTKLVIDKGWESIDKYRFPGSIVGIAEFGHRIGCYRALVDNFLYGDLNDIYPGVDNTLNYFFDEIGPKYFTEKEIDDLVALSDGLYDKMVYRLNNENVDILYYLRDLLNKLTRIFFNMDIEDYGKRYGFESVYFYVPTSDELENLEKEIEEIKNNHIKEERKFGYALSKKFYEKSNDVDVEELLRERLKELKKKIIRDKKEWDGGPIYFSIWNELSYNKVIDELDIMGNPDSVEEFSTIEDLLKAIDEEIKNPSGEGYGVDISGFSHYFEVKLYLSDFR